MNDMITPELVKTFTLDRDKARRTLSPSEAAEQIADLFKVGLSSKELASKLCLSENGKIIRYLRHIGKIDLHIREVYLSPFWKPSKHLRHSRNQISFSTFGELACAIKDCETPSNISRAFQLAARYNFSSKLIREINYTMRVWGFSSVVDAIEKIEDTRGIYGSKNPNHHFQSFIAKANQGQLTQEKAVKIKSAIEKRIGAIVDEVAQVGVAIDVKILPNKISDEALDKLITAEEVQVIVSSILKESLNV